MIAVDTNILVYAHRTDVEWHTAAASAVRALAEARAAWAIPWPCVHEFLSIVSNPKVFVHPTPPEAAVDQVSAWIESPGLSLLAEGPGYWNALAPLVARTKVRGGAVHDARIAAICLEHGVSELWTADRDFSRFAELKARNPLVSSR